MATKALTKRLIKELGEAIAKTGSIKIAIGHVKLPRSTYYFWKKQAEEIEANNPERENLTKDEELLLEFLDVLDFSKAEAGVTLTNAAWKAVARGDSKVIIHMLRSLFGSEFNIPTGQIQPEIKENQEDSNSGIALIPTMNDGQNLEDLLKKQQMSAQELARTKTKELKNGGN